MKRLLLLTLAASAWLIGRADPPVPAAHQPAAPASVVSDLEGDPFYEDYDDDFYYSRRLRRFHAPRQARRAWQYYDPYFTNDIYFVIGTPYWNRWADLYNPWRYRTAAFSYSRFWWWGSFNTVQVHATGWNPWGYADVFYYDNWYDAFYAPVVVYNTYNYYGGWNSWGWNNWNSGYNRGWNRGYNNGYRRGYRDGFNAGYCDGYYNGYSNGVTRGAGSYSNDYWTRRNQAGSYQNTQPGYSPRTAIDRNSISNTRNDVRQIEPAVPGNRLDRPIDNGTLTERPVRPSAPSTTRPLPSSPGTGGRTLSETPGNAQTPGGRPIPAQPDSRVNRIQETPAPVTRPGSTYERPAQSGTRVTPGTRPGLNEDVFERNAPGAPRPNAPSYERPSAPAPRVNSTPVPSPRPSPPSYERPSAPAPRVNSTPAPSPRPSSPSYERPSAPSPRVNSSPSPSRPASPSYERPSAPSPSARPSAQPSSGSRPSGSSSSGRPGRP
ncbi:MAG: hypothetical protein NW241_16180 [Bacteroidia bacterium]|nr:hypothetical protein [Bacteroidia bacterium]